MELTAQVVGTLIAAYLIVPLLEVSWQAFRAPSLQLQAANKRLVDDLTEVRERLTAMEIERDSFKVTATIGVLMWSQDPSAPDRQYVITNGTYLANHSHKEVPVHVSMRVSMTETSAVEMGAKTLALPFSVPELVGATKLPVAVTVPAMGISEMGYWAFGVHDTYVKQSGCEDVEELAATRPLWLALQNVITREMIYLPVNAPARIEWAEHGGPSPHDITASPIVAGAEGKRLTYKQPGGASAN